jgi:hypothetical protein
MAEDRGTVLEKEAASFVPLPASRQGLEACQDSIHSSYIRSQVYRNS